MSAPPSAHRHPPVDFDGVLADGIGAEAPVPSRGDSGEYLLVLRNTTGHSDETDRNSAMARYEELMARSLHAGEFETIPLADGRVKYVDETPFDWDHDVLVRLQTPPEFEVPSRYGLLESVDTAQPPHRDGPIAVNVSLVYLAPLTEYDTKADVRQDLEAPGL